jgi:hypothetical protein
MEADMTEGAAKPMSKSDYIRWLRDGIMGLVNGSHARRHYEARMSEPERNAELEARVASLELAVMELEARVASLERATVTLAVATQSWSAWSSGQIGADFIWRELVMKSVKDLPGGRDAAW